MMRISGKPISIIHLVHVIWLNIIDNASVLLFAFTCWSLQPPWIAKLWLSFPPNCPPPFMTICDSSAQLSSYQMIVGLHSSGVLQTIFAGNIIPPAASCSYIEYGTPIQKHFLACITLQGLDTICLQLH